MTWDSTHDDIENAARYIEAHPGGVTDRELGEAFGKDRSTGHRWRKKIEQRYDVELVPGDRGRYRLAEPLGHVRLRKAEALTVYLALRRFIRQTNKAPTFMTSAIRKVIGVLVREDLRENLAGAADMLKQYHAADDQYENIWQTLLDGWTGCRVVLIDYLKPGQTQADRHTSEIYLFEPMPGGDGVYIIAWSRERNAIRQFKIDRIQRAILTMDVFEPRAELDIDHLIRHALGVWMADEKHPLQQVVLRFSPEKAHRVEESVYIEVEHKERQPDGSLIWSAQVAALREVKHWIYSWGAGVEVLEPLQLRREVAAELRKAADQYHD